MSDNFEHQERQMKAKLVLCLGFGVASLAAIERAAAQEPEWTPRVLKVGEDRESTNATDITQRPYRPLHFYGNTVRRMHYRGTPLPKPQDLSNTVRYVLRRE